MFGLVCPATTLHNTTKCSRFESSNRFVDEVRVHSASECSGGLSAAVVSVSYTQPRG